MDIWLCDIDYVRISKLLRLLTFTWLSRELSCCLRRGTWLSEQFMFQKKYYFNVFCVLQEINSRFSSKTHWQMFLLVSGRHVGAHPYGHQHGVSVQISINLGKNFIHISCLQNLAVNWTLARILANLPFFQILDYWTVFIFILWSILNGVTLKIFLLLFCRFSTVISLLV